MMTKLLLLSLCLCALARAQDRQTEKEVFLRVPPSITKQTIDCIYKTNGDQMCVYRSDGAVTITCEATGFPDPEFKWYKNGAVLDLGRPNIRPQGAGGIVISPATSLDEGYYQCRAENAYGTALGNTFQLLKATLANYPPNLPIQEYSASPGEALQINCNPIKSVPKAGYTWGIAIDRVDEGPQNLDFSQRINIDPNGNLYFTNIVSADDQGGKLYKCNVNNAQLDFTTGGSYSRINIINPGPTPNVPPSGKYQSPSPHIALVGNDMTIQCLFSGSPSPSISWQKQGGQLPQGRIEQKSFNSQLIVNSIRETDEGSYVCSGANAAGRAEQTIFVKVEAVPVFRTATMAERPVNVNITNDEDVTFNCKPYAIPMATIQWLMNGNVLNAGNLPERISISDDGQSLTISKVCKDCEGGQRATDLMVVQCNASNTHGYAFGDGYLNVLLPTAFVVSPPPRVEIKADTRVELPCTAEGDDSTPVFYSWFFNDEKLILKPPYTNLQADNTLVINTNGLEGEDWKAYPGMYSCKASNGYSTIEAESLVEMPPGEKPITGAGIGSMWWIFLIIAIVLLLLILLLCCCLCMQRNKGDTYPVDERERKNGNDPEKELADSGFADYQRPEDEPTKGSRASLSSTIKMDSDDEGSLAEYGDIDTGKFNEDGSFIGQYMEKNKSRPQDTTV